jgi:DNA-binding response OmpR family regulator
MAPSGAPRRILGFGSFEVDLASGELRREGLKVKLQDQPLRLLVLLLESAGEVVTREELRDKLWPADTFVDLTTASTRRSGSCGKPWATRPRLPVTSRPLRGEVTDLPSR